MKQNSHIPVIRLSMLHFWTSKKAKMPACVYVSPTMTLWSTPGMRTGDIHHRNICINNLKGRKLLSQSSHYYYWCICRTQVAGELQSEKTKLKIPVSLVLCHLNTLPFYSNMCLMFNQTAHKHLQSTVYMWILFQGFKQTRHFIKTCIFINLSSTIISLNVLII